MNLLLLILGLGLVLAQLENTDTSCVSVVNGITMSLSKTQTFPMETCLRLGAALRQAIENRVAEHVDILVASRRRFTVPDDAHNISCSIGMSEKNFTLPNMLSLEECRLYQGHMNILAEVVAYAHIAAQQRYHDLTDPPEEEEEVDDTSRTNASSTNAAACPAAPVLCYFGTTGFKKDDWTTRDCETANKVYIKCLGHGLLSDIACVNHAVFSME